MPGTTRTHKSKYKQIQSILQFYRCFCRNCESFKMCSVFQLCSKTTHVLKYSKENKIFLYVTILNIFFYFYVQYRFKQLTIKSQ